MKKVINLLPNQKEYCLLVKSAFSADFCKQMIVEKKNAFKSAKTHYPTSYRNNERQVLDNEQLSNQLFEEIKNYIPSKIEVEGISEAERGQWKLDSLNSRIRICRYLPKQYFNKHLDGVHFVSETKQSKLTFMIYLNDNEEFDGGRTLFFNSKEDNTIIESYKPERGDLIIFDHNLWHAGETVKNGEKYILRSDIIYQKINQDVILKDKFCGEGHLGYIWTATIFKDWIITSGRDKKMKFWSEEGLKIKEIEGHKNSIFSLIVFDDKRIISASRDQTIKIWKQSEIGDFELENTLNYHKGSVLSLCKINNQLFFSGGTDGIVNQIHRNGELVNKFKAHDEWIWDIVKVNDEYYITISEDGIMKIWTIKDNRLVNTWKTNVPINSITVKNEIIFIGKFDGTIVKLKFDIKNEGLKQLIERKGHLGIIRKLLVDELYLYSASEDNTLKIWNQTDLVCIKSFKHKNFVQDIALLKDSVITVSYDGVIHKNKRPNFNK